MARIWDAKIVSYFFAALRATESNNYPTLLVFSLSFCVTASVAYFNMRHLPRLESEQKSGAIFG